MSSSRDLRRGLSSVPGSLDELASRAFVLSSSSAVLCGVPELWDGCYMLLIMKWACWALTRHEAFALRLAVCNVADERRFVGWKSLEHNSEPGG